MNQKPQKKVITAMWQRFRGYLPVVIDVETGGLNPKTDALLEIAAVFVTMNSEGILERGETYFQHVTPFPNANLDPEALQLNGIDPFHPFRFAVDEKIALEKIFEKVEAELQRTQCQRAVLVGHNAWFDLFFMRAAAERAGIKKNPFHSFTTFDTATLSALAYGQTVLARAVIGSGLSFNHESAHSAIYDAEITADLFCRIVNQSKTCFFG